MGSPSPPAGLGLKIFDTVTFIRPLRKRNPLCDIHTWQLTLLGGAATCSEGFVTCFLKVPLACLGGMEAAVEPNSLGSLRKHFTKLSEQVAAPPDTF